MSIIAWIVLGLVAGWLAGLVMKGSGYGILGDIVVGIVGALIGGFIASALGMGDVTGLNIGSIVIAFVGACILIFVLRMFSGRRAVA
jgi:uncharacterized membrane protein YeaQ/YmgE (transglycosylase-associated protein family)